jgi:hypothetical protein
MPQLGDFEWLLRCLKLGYDPERPCAIGFTQRRFRQTHLGVDKISLNGWNYSEIIAMSVF